MALNRKVTHHTRYPDPRDAAGWEALDTDPRMPPRLCDGKRTGKRTAGFLDKATCKACQSKLEALEAVTAKVAADLHALARRGLLFVYDAGTGQSMYVETVSTNGGIQIGLAPDPEVFASDVSPRPTHTRILRRK